MVTPFFVAAVVRRLGLASGVTAAATFKPRWWGALSERAAAATSASALAAKGLAALPYEYTPQ